ncbi:hypothetical protein D1007_62425 [Hordeum vulgare]|nr:hypothetical protein D1007_62425 [Hordeum vulgare]
MFVKSSRNGKGLEKLTRAMGAKVRIEIVEGMRHPEKSVLATKLAFEGGLIARAHMPLLPHFKEYKKNPSLVQNYIGKVSFAAFVGNFEMDTESSVIEYGCTDILKNSLRNRHHHVKKEYFDNVEASKVSIKSPVSDIKDTECQSLVELWSTPRHKETCANNNVNRTKVKFAQKNWFKMLCCSCACNSKINTVVPLVVFL